MFEAYANFPKSAAIFKQTERHYFSNFVPFRIALHVIEFLLQKT